MTETTSATWATQVHHHLPWAFFNEQFLGAFLGLPLPTTVVLIAEEWAARGARVSASVTAG